MNANVIAEEVLTQIARLRQELELPSAPVDLTLKLHSDLGFDSLDIAVLVVRLEDRLGVDPFHSSGQVIATTGDLVKAYCDLMLKRHSL